MPNDAAESEHRNSCKSGAAGSGIAGESSQNSQMGSRLSGPITNEVADQGPRSGVGSPNEGLKALRRLGSVTSAAAVKCIADRQLGGSGGSCASAGGGSDRAQQGDDLSGCSLVDGGIAGSASVDGFSGGSTGGGCGATGFTSLTGDGGLAANGQLTEVATGILRAGT